jgi:hypothetical protein
MTPQKSLYSPHLQRRLELSDLLDLVILRKPSLIREYYENFAGFLWVQMPMYHLQYSSGLQPPPTLELPRNLDVVL